MLAKNLIKHRKRRGMTQKDVAERLHISPQAYARYERTDEKRNEPNSENLSKLADLYEVTVDDLLGRTTGSGNDFFSKAEAIMFKDIEGFEDLPPEKQEEIRRTINEQIEFLVHREKKDS